MRAAATAPSARHGVLSIVQGAAAELRHRLARRPGRGSEAPTYYTVLGVLPDADDQRIKAAYRTLARSLHPDVNAGDAAFAERLAAVNEAYETLADAQARSAYDRDLARQRSELRRSWALFAATTAATFVVTAAAASLAVRWHLQAAPRAGLSAAAPGKGAMAQSRMPDGTDLGLPPRGGDGSGQAAGVANWTTYRDPRFDFALRYPAGVFAFEPARSDANVRTFVSRDGHASLRIVAAENTAGIKLASFRSALIEERYAGAAFDKAPQRRHWFALSGTRGGEVFLERVTFSCDGKSMHGWRMLYPAAERAAYDGLAQLVLRNPPHGNGPAAACDGDKPKVKEKKRKKR
jgi:curved DNA-binding protein CbpA